MYLFVIDVYSGERLIKQETIYGTDELDAAKKWSALTNRSVSEARMVYHINATKVKK